MDSEQTKLSFLDKQKDSNKVFVKTWDAKRCRAYRNILFGLKKSKIIDADCRFMTLTTSRLQYDMEGYDCKDLNEHFRVLKGRLLRLRPVDLVKAGYISRSDAVYYYGHSKMYKRFPFDYFKVITNEGNGVIHILYRGWFIPYNWLVDNWQDIHNSWEVNIQRIAKLKKSVRGVAGYIVGQYVAGQDVSYVRFSQSWSWVYRGYVEDWNIFKKWFHGKDLIRVWNGKLRYMISLDVQSSFDLLTGLWST